MQKSYYARALMLPVLIVALLAMATPSVAASPDAPNSQSVSSNSQSDNRYAPNSTVAYPYCTTYRNVPLKSGAPEFGQIPLTGSNFNCILETGNNSRAVEILQNHLNRCYGRGIATDGAFGPATYNALIAVQRQIGASADGVYGPGTRGLMNFFASNLTCNRITAYSGF